MSVVHKISAAKFGTAPVFLTAISTILGAIMFLRFGYAVGNVGFFGVAIIILLGHMVTIPTAMAIAEIATNQRVEGGGEYYIISRSFGLTVGGAIGIALFLSQAISAAFYVMAFAEAFDPILNWLRESHGILITDKRLIAVPSLLALNFLMLTKGADLGVKILYAVVAVLGVSLASFFLGGSNIHSEPTFEVLTRTIKDPDPFFYVFAICFPAFTGMTAGVGLSGDLRDPKKSIPLGTLSATLMGMVIYLLLAYKLAVSAPSQLLNDDQLVMSHIALWAPLIPIGLACATISSALGSLMVAPRTLQAIGGDRLMPIAGANKWLERGGGTKGDEPINASWVASIIAMAFVLLGDINMVAEIISMFFMVTYGSICLISFLEHFAADPSYRPTFTSRWYISLFGAVTCGWLMIEMNAGYAAIAAVIMVAIYAVISIYNPEKAGLAAIFQGVIFQVSRKIQIFLQGAYLNRGALKWRPSLVCISQNSFRRQSAFDLIRWISYRYGFGTYIHFVRGYLSKESNQLAEKALDRLIRMAGASRGRVYVDTLISPSDTTAICQVIQLPGISGHENNGILFEFAKSDMEGTDDIISNIPLVMSAKFDVYVLGSSERKFGYRRQIHIWLRPADFENASLMILMSFILLGDPEWRKGSVTIFATYPEQMHEQESERLRILIKAGRLPFSPQNIRMISQAEGGKFKDLVNTHSQEADLVILGLKQEMLKHKGREVFEGFSDVGDVLFVLTNQRKLIATTQEIQQVEESPPPHQPEPKVPAKVETAALVVAAVVTSTLVIPPEATAAVDSAAVDSPAVDSAAVDSATAETAIHEQEKERPGLKPRPKKTFSKTGKKPNRK